VAEENKAEDQEQEEGAAAPSSKKKIIIIAAVALLVLGIGGGAAFFLLGGEEPVEGEEVVEEEVQGPALYYDLTPPMLTTYTVNSRQRYMQVSLSVMAREQAALDAVEYHMPSIRSRLNALFSAADFKMLQTPEGKGALLEQTVDAINVILEGEGEPPIETIYFTNFVMQ
jgi:flagellar FliL protein